MTQTQKQISEAIEALDNIIPSRQIAFDSERSELSVELEKLLQWAKEDEL